MEKRSIRPPETQLKRKEEWLWAQLTELYWNVFYRPDWRDVLDILIVAFLIYQILRFTRQTRGSSVFKGLVIIMLVTWVSAAAKLRALNWVLVQLINITM